MEIRIYCGKTIEKLTDREYHPYSAVERAFKAITLNENNKIFYSNSPDFVQAIKYLCEKQNINVEFFLNGVSVGNDIEPIFEDFNRSIKLLDEYLNTK